MSNCGSLLIVHTIPVVAKDLPFYTLIPNRMGGMFGGGVDVKFIGICIGSPSTEEHDNHSSEWIQIDPDKHSSISVVYAKLKLFLRITELCRANKITVMNSMRHYDFFVIACLAKLFKTNAVVRVTGILPRDGRYGVVKRFRKFIAVIFERFTIRMCSSAIALSEDLAQTLVRYGSDPAKICLVSQGIDAAKYTPKSFELVSLQPRKLLFVGRLNMLKGVEDAILAFIDLKKIYPSLVLSLCGVGPEETRLRAQYGSTDGLTFLGFVDKDDLPSLYSDNDILLLPSYSEGLPNVVLEAMVSRLFVVASNVGGIKQLLGEGRGKIHEAGDIAGIVRILISVIENTDLRLECTDNAFKYAIAEHSFSAVRQKYLKLLNCCD